MKYKLLAIDVDGTLLGEDHFIRAGVKHALHLAKSRGLQVVLATGRSYIETIAHWRQLQLDDTDAMVLIGGALVSEAGTGRTLYHKLIPHELANEYAQALAAAGHSAMGIVDAWRWQLDYLVLPSDDADRIASGWFAKMNVKVRHVQSMDGQGPAVLRIHAICDNAAATELADRLSQQFAQRLNIHAIVAPNYGVTIVEAFNASATKWTALQYVAQATRVGPGAIAAIGDDVNDLPMIRSAGLGAAMPQACDSVKQQAKVIAEDGLAKFIIDLADGRYD